MTARIHIFGEQAVDPDEASGGGTTWQPIDQPTAFASALGHTILFQPDVDTEVLILRDVTVPSDVWTKGLEAVTDWADHYLWDHTGAAQRVVMVGSRYPGGEARRLAAAATQPLGGDALGKEHTDE